MKKILWYSLFTSYLMVSFMIYIIFEVYNIPKRITSGIKLAFPLN